MKKVSVLKCVTMALIVVATAGGCAKAPVEANVIESVQPAVAASEKGQAKENAATGVEAKGQEKAGVPVDRDNNLIDKAFKKDFEAAATTVEINLVSSYYYDAWKAEWKNITAEIQKKYKFDEDKKIIDQYKENFEALAKSAGEVEYLEWTDTTVEPGSGRVTGTAGSSASMGAETEKYKEEVLKLIARYYGEEPYKYSYKGNGAELEKFREESGQ